MRFDRHQDQVFKNVLAAAVNRQFVVDVVSDGGVAFFDLVDLFVRQSQIAQGRFLRFSDVFQKFFAHGVERAAAPFARLFVGNGPFNFFQFETVDFGKVELAARGVQLCLRFRGFARFSGSVLFRAFCVNVAVFGNHGNHPFQSKNLFKKDIATKRIFCLFFLSRFLHFLQNGGRGGVLVQRGFDAFAVGRRNENAAFGIGDFDGFRFPRLHFADLHVGHFVKISVVGIVFNQDEVGKLVFSAAAQRPFVVNVVSVRRAPFRHAGDHIVRHPQRL